jgi:glycosyltransferase involved in cell wall biosynthesis
VLLAVKADTILQQFHSTRTPVFNEIAEVGQVASPPAMRRAPGSEIRDQGPEQPRRNGPKHQYLADFSLALINRTGAYHISRDLLEILPGMFRATRYWRFNFSHEPTGLLRWLLGKAMLKELVRISAPGGDRFRRAPSDRLPTLFLDPLYVLMSGVQSCDIVLCHDVGPISHAELFDPTTSRMYRMAYRMISETRPGIVFVSEASERQFVAHYGDRFRFLKVIPLYVRDGLRQAPDQIPSGIGKPFLLTVGALELRKNYARSIEAFRRSGLAERGFTYLICGPRGNAAEMVEQLGKVTPGVHVLGYRTDAELLWLFRNATGFVLPSLLEGFGIPGLEAAQHGLLALVSAGSAQDEALDGAAVLVDPYSADSIAAGMTRLVDMSHDERQTMMDKALRRAQELSFGAYRERWSQLLMTLALEPLAS